MRDVAHEADELAVREHRHRHVDVGQMRAARDERIVGDEDVALADVRSGTLASSVFIRPIIEPRWIAQRILGLHDQPPARIDDRGRMVVPLLDVGRVRALHQRDEGLVGDRLQAVRDDLERDRIDAHAAMSTIEVEVGIDRGAVAGKEQRGRVELLDDRGARDGVAGQQRRAIVDRRVLRGVGARTRPCARDRGLGLAGLARSPGRAAGLAQLADRDQPEVHDLDRVGRIVEAVGALVLGKEALLDRRRRAGSGSALPSPIAQLEILPDIARIEHDIDVAVRRARRLRASNQSSACAFNSSMRSRDIVHPRIAQRRHGRAHEGLAQVGDDQPLRAQDARRGRHQRAADAEALRDVGRVQRPGAAERQQREVARIVAALDRHRADRPHHVGDHDAENAVRGALDREAEPLGERRDRLARAGRRRAACRRRSGRAARGGRAPGWRR